MDWIAYLFFILQMWLISYKPRCIQEVFEVEKLGFLSGFFGCISMIVFGMQISSTPMIIVNIVLAFLNFKGYIK